MTRAKDNETEAVTVVSPDARLVKVSALMDKVDNVSRLMERVLFLPNAADGKISGIKISDISAADLGKDLGVKPDSIIKAVNGMPLNSFNDLKAIYGNYKNEEIVNLIIERDGGIKAVLPLSGMNAYITPSSRPQDRYCPKIEKAPVDLATIILLLFMALLTCVNFYLPMTLFAC